MAIKKHMDIIEKGFNGLAKEAIKKGKDAVYTAAAGVEQHANYRGIKKLVKIAAEKGREIRQTVEENGGLVNIAQNAAEKASNAADSLIERLSQKYNSFENVFFTNGKLDYAKVDKALENASDVAERYGTKALISLRVIASRTAERVKQEYRDIAPSKEERMTTYAGIGSEYRGILTRQDYDRCLDFHEKTRKNIAGRPEYKARLLADIKNHAVGSKRELIELYKETENKTLLEIAKKL